MSKLFSIIVPITLTTVFLVILAGGVVRTTGSGMGCPDWPKCFGQYIPPTDASQLPVDYKTRFAVKGKEIATFEAFKTWTEYINRLLGALLGLFVFVQLVSGFPRWKRDKLTVWLCVGMLVMTGFVGWLGSVVVATDLQPVKITTHMLSALVILGMSVMIVLRTSRSTSSIQVTSQFSQALKPFLLLALGMTLVQVMLGTQVREQIDEMAKVLNGGARDLWIDQLSAIFKIHRTFSLLVLAVNATIMYVVFKKSGGVVGIRAYAVVLGLCVTSEILLGVILSYFAMPTFAQPLHLLFASGMFAAQWAMLLTNKTLTNVLDSNNVQM